MREDLRAAFPIFLLGVTFLVDVVDLVECSGGPRDPTWETRWRALESAESAWLAVMAGSRSWIASLTDPEEVRRDAAGSTSTWRRRHR
jgi:hypothetical protein